MYAGASEAVLPLDMRQSRRSLFGDASTAWNAGRKFQQAEHCVLSYKLHAVHANRECHACQIVERGLSFRSQLACNDVALGANGRQS